MNLEKLLSGRLGPAFSAVAGQAAGKTAGPAAGSSAEPAAGEAAEPAADDAAEPAAPDGQAIPVDPAVRRSQRADFQSDAALALARRLGRPPRDIAAEVLGLADLGDLCRAEVSGPGFINLTVADSALGTLLSGMAAGERLGVVPPEVSETVVVDYSGPNVAKEMHVGHLRSTVIGDATVRLLEWLGHRVVRVNHLGDWGTPFGMLIEHLIDVGESEAAHDLSVGDLDSFYRAARVAFDADEAFGERARSRVVALQSGDADSRRLWRLLVEESEKYFLAVYDRLDVTLTEADFYPESFYNDLLGPVVDELDRLGLLTTSAGAACVFPHGFPGRDGRPLPIIVRKSDGGYGYGATDLAAIRHRTQTLGATRLLYVVGLPQRQHLEMVHQTAREAGWLSPPARAQHVGFGSVLGADGRMLRSRAGTNVKLIELLDEAVARAAELARSKSPDLDERTIAEVARAVGIGAVKYADLSTYRVKDYVFDWDRMLSLDGNTSAYLQYAHARIRSIFRRAGAVTARGDITVTEPAEHALALELLDFGDAVASTAETLEFHRLTGHLYTVATAFSAFFEQCPVLRAGDGVRDSRLALCDLTGRVLRQGLALLGIATPDRM
ncbi:arginine--tRNA ligase [Rugosimonospora africana]|uniref:Arginine--tRNA ligase n=1 Tax=Rugosimonospora africana TaxID=556532 RepID=A0A8J3QLB3_9ACTN|nr:arginine--tRNA ligase [Rugosimonospora africana]GIH13049.1 arginine--tRNA ligase [Rugosimonospora africana]